MRVIGGHDRGRRLRAPRGLATRPTADRVRVTLFDVLGPAVAGARILDLYAGTGAVGIEALSRGAARVVLWSATSRRSARCAPTSRRSARRERPRG
jgi:16S rRNA (guanine(966)-N(2))-methyltransferase RsmD